MNKNIKIIFMFFILISITASCNYDENQEVDKCENIDCSNNGTCYVDHGYYTRCMCNDGYYEQGNNCIKYSCKDGYELDGTICIKKCQDCQGEETYNSNPCENKDCSGNGYCKSDPDRTVYCNCYKGYKSETGLLCVVSECDGVSCAS